MNLSYDWRFNTPADALAVHMNVADHQRKLLDATLALKRHAITGASLARVTTRFPVMTQRVSLSIYWQALKLYLKRTPYYLHLSGQAEPTPAASHKQHHHEQDTTADIR